MISLARIETRRLVVKGVMSFSLISIVIAIFAVALQCALPRPWAISSNSCFHQVQLALLASGTIAKEKIRLHSGTVLVPWIP